MAASLYERVGGRRTLERVHKILYDKLYSDPWLGQFFEGIDRPHIEKQQSDFMGQVMGGPKIYRGRIPRDAHTHLYITAEMYTHRYQMLRAALLECEVDTNDMRAWLRLDRSLKARIVKDGPEACVGRWKTDKIVIISRK